MKRIDVRTSRLSFDHEHNRKQRWAIQEENSAEENASPSIPSRAIEYLRSRIQRPKTGRSVLIGWLLVVLVLMVPQHAVSMVNRSNATDRTISQLIGSSELARNFDVTGGGNLSLRILVMDFESMETVDATVTLTLLGSPSTWQGATTNGAIEFNNLTQGFYEVQLSNVANGCQTSAASEVNLTASILVMVPVYCP